MDFLYEVWRSPDFQALLGQLVVAFFGLLATGVTGALLGFVRSKTTAAQFEQLQLFAVYAVRAAEQGALAGFVKDKKASAINVVNAYLKAAGVTGVSADAIDAAIEAAVLSQFNAHRTQPMPPFAFPFGPLPTPDENGGEEGAPAPAAEEANG